MRNIKRTRRTLAGIAALAAWGATPGAVAGAQEQSGVGAGWTPVATSREFTIEWTVRGRLRERPGDFHTVMARSDWDDLQVWIGLSDYRCPAGVTGPAGCALVGGGGGYTTESVSPGDGVTYVGAAGIDVDAVIAGELAGPLRMRLRPAGPLSHTVLGRMEEWETFRVDAEGRIGQLDLSRARITSADLSVVTSYAWTGPGAPPRTHVPASRAGLASDQRSSSAHWIRMGTLPGRAGNAHSGWVSALAQFAEPRAGRQASTSAEWNDWRCPPGVRPPAFALRGAGCTLLRTEHAWGRMLPAAPVGPLGLRVTGQLPTSVLLPASVGGGTRSVDWTATPAGDSHTEQTPAEPGARIVTREFVGSTPTGRLGGIDLATANAGGGHTSIFKYWTSRS